MPDALTPVSVIDGRCGRTLANALTIAFFEDSTSPLATARQGAGDSVGGKLGILFGFRNGSPGNHVLTYSNGSTLLIPTRDLAPTTVSREGMPVATLTRGATTVATLPDGSELLHFVPHPTEAMASAAYRIMVQSPDGAQVAGLDVIRSNEGWDITAEDVLDFISGTPGADVGGSLPIPFRGTRIVLYRTLTQVERDVLLAACVEIALGVRPYIAEMGERGAAWT